MTPRGKGTSRCLYDQQTGTPSAIRSTILIRLHEVYHIPVVSREYLFSSKNVGENIKKMTIGRALDNY